MHPIDKTKGKKILISFSYFSY